MGELQHGFRVWKELAACFLKFENRLQAQCSIATEF